MLGKSRNAQLFLLSQDPIGFPKEGSTSRISGRICTLTGDAGSNLTWQRLVLLGVSGYWWVDDCV